MADRRQSAEPKKSRIRRLVLDILKPHSPELIELADTLCQLSGVDGVNLVLYEIDKNTETIKLTLQGKAIVYKEVKEAVEDAGGVIHSIDEVAAGNEIIEEVETPQDKLMIK
ncbi:MAG: DUF211 domain-containing protein [archaeon]